MQRCPAQPVNESTTLCTVSRSSASGTTITCVLRAAEAQRALAARGRPRVHRARRRRRADEADRAHARVIGQRFDRLAVAVHDGEDARRDSRPRPSARPAGSAESGTFSDGLRMKALPTVSAMGNIHSGTMAGKVERRDAGDDAERLAAVLAGDAARDLERAARVEVRQAERELDHLEPALNSGARLVGGLARFGGDGVGQVVERRRDAARGSARAAAPVRAAASRPRPARRAAAAVTAASTSAAPDRATRPMMRPLYGLAISRLRPDAPRCGAPPTRFWQSTGSRGRATVTRGGCCITGCTEPLAYLPQPAFTRFASRVASSSSVAGVAASCVGRRAARAEWH